MYIYIYIIFVCTCETMQECQERCIFLGEASFSVSVWFVSCLYVSDILYVCLVSNLSGIMSRRAQRFSTFFPFSPPFSPIFFLFLCSLLLHFVFSPLSLALVQPTRERELI